MYTFLVLYAILFGNLLGIGSVLALSLLTYGVMAFFSYVQDLTINSVNSAVATATEAAGSAVRGSTVPISQTA